jgi:YVTN family beta-propeller protein
VKGTRGRGIGTNAAIAVLLAVAFIAAAPVASAIGPHPEVSGPPVVVANITVGTAPGYDHYDSARGDTYVSNSGSANVSVINDAALKVVATVAVGTTPKGIDYDPVTGTIWVANSGGTSVSVISDQSNAVVSAVTGLTSPTRPEWDPTNSTMWVTENLTAGAVVVYNGTSDAKVTTLRAGTNTVGITHDPARKAMLVGNYGSANITVFNATSYAKLATVTVGAHPEAIACYDGDGLGVCAVASMTTDTLYLVNDTTWTVSTTVAVGTSPIGVQVDNATRDAYVTNAGAGTVSVVSLVTNAVAYTVGVGTSPHGVTAYDPVRGLLLVSNQGSNNVTVISDGSGGSGGGGAGGAGTTASTIADLVLLVVAVGLIFGVLLVLARYSERGHR